MRNELSDVKIKYDKSLMQYDTVMNELDNQTITDLSERIEETFTKMKNCRHLDNDIKSKTKHVSDLKASYKKTLAKVIKRRDQIYEECSNLQMTNLEEYDDNFMYYEAESFEPYLLNAQAKFVTQFNACIKPFIRCLKI
jgi:DNA repair ATPase RecN